MGNFLTEPTPPDNEPLVESITSHKVTVDAEPTKHLFGLHPDITILVCGTAEALPLLTKAWQQKAQPAKIIPRLVDAVSFPELMIALMADDSIPDAFIFVPANCFPTHRLCLSDLAAYRVRRMQMDPVACKDVAWTGLPVLLEAHLVLQVLKALDAQDTFNEEEFLSKYNTLAHPGQLPEIISMYIGSTVAYAESPTPCPAKVAEALLRKKFICTNAEGFHPIKEKLALLYE